MKYNLILASFLFTAGLDAASPTNGNGGIPLWTNRYDGPAQNYDQATALSVDDEGNVIIAGGSVGLDNDYLTIKYSPSGVPLWTNRFHGENSLQDHANVVCVDEAGAVYVSGYSQGPAPDFFTDCVTIAYSSAGVPLWTNRFRGSGGSANVQGIVTDRNGRLFVTGTAHIAGNSLSSYATRGLTTTGLPLWTNYYGGNTPGVGSGDIAKAIALDSHGNVFVTGEAHADAVTVGYSSTGIPLWTNRYDGPYEPEDATDQAVAIAVDRDGNAFVTGSARANATRFDWITIKYSNAGMPLWTNLHDGLSSGDDSGGSLVLDGSGNLFASGRLEPSSAVIKYSNTGTPLWTNRFVAGASAGIAADAMGNVFATSENLIMGLSNDGGILWTNGFTGGALRIAVDLSGNVVIAGNTPGNGLDALVIKYATVVPPRIPLESHHMGNQLVLTWTNPVFRLQRAPEVTGTFTNIPDATSPFTNSLAEPRRFFRLISE